MTLTETLEAGVRTVRNATGNIVLREGEIRTSIDGQPGRVRVRRFRNDIMIVDPNAPPAPTTLGDFFNYVPHIEREVESVHEEADLIDGRELTGKHVTPPTTPVYGRYVREHPFRSEMITLIGHLSISALISRLTTVGYSLPDEFLPGQPLTKNGLVPKDPHGQLVVQGVDVPTKLNDLLVSLAVADHPQVKKFSHTDGSRTYVLRGDDGEFGQQEMWSFDRKLTALYRKVSLDCNQFGRPQKLTVHFSWFGPVRASRS